MFRHKVLKRIEERKSYIRPPHLCRRKRLYGIDLPFTNCSR